MKIQKFNLGDNIEMFGFENEYITDIILKTRTYYEVEILNKWSTYLSDIDSIFDIGANIGNHSIYWLNNLENIKLLISFEPLPLTYSVLKMNHTLYQSDIWKIENMMVSDIDGTGIPTHINKQNMGVTTFSITSSENENTIPSVSLDTYLLNISSFNLGVPFFKIDTEGFELDILKGMTKTLEKYDALIWVEVTLATVEDVIHFLISKGYYIIDVHHFNILFGKGQNLISKQITLQVVIKRMLEQMQSSWKNYSAYLSMTKKFSESSSKEKLLKIRIESLENELSTLKSK